MPGDELEPGAYYMLRDRVPIRACCAGEPPVVPPHWRVRGGGLKVCEAKERGADWVCFRVT